MTVPRTVFLLLALAVGGCDVFGGADTAVSVTGRVIDARTGAPIAGIAVLIVDGGWISFVEAEVRTGPDGHFAVAHDDGELPHTFRVYVNTRPQSLRPHAPAPDPRYSYRVASVRRGEALAMGDVALPRREGAWPIE